MQHRHAGDRGAGFGGGRVDGVVGSDDQDDVGVGEVLVDLVHLHDDVVGDVGLGEQHVHVARQTSGHRMDGELDVDALRGELGGEVGHRVLRLGDGHAIARSDDDLAGIGQLGGEFVGLDLGDLTGGTVVLLGDGVTESTEDHRGERAVHGLAHDVGQDGTGETDQGTSDDEHRDLQAEPGERCGPTRVTVEHRDDDRHVGTADGCHQMAAQDQ